MHILVTFCQSPQLQYCHIVTEEHEVFVLVHFEIEEDALDYQLRDNSSLQSEIHSLLYNNYTNKGFTWMNLSLSSLFVCLISFPVAPQAGFLHRVGEVLAPQ